MNRICLRCSKPEVHELKLVPICEKCIDIVTTADDKARGGQAAIVKVSYAMRKGLLPRLSKVNVLCACGERALIYEHRDYSKPLEVEPTCRKCNINRYLAKPAAGYVPCKWMRLLMVFRCVEDRYATGKRTRIVGRRGYGNSRYSLVTSSAERTDDQ